MAIIFNFYLENDITMCSIYEYLYSFRETVDSPMPEFNSQRAVEAFEKYDKIKKEVSSRNYFSYIYIKKEK